MIKAEKSEQEALVEDVKDSLRRDYFFVTKTKATVAITGFLTFASLTGLGSYYTVKEEIQEGLSAAGLDLYKVQAQAHVDAAEGEAAAAAKSRAKANESANAAESMAQRARNLAAEILALLESSKDGDLRVRSLTVTGEDSTSSMNARGFHVARKDGQGASLSLEDHKLGKEDYLGVQLLFLGPGKRPTLAMQSFAHPTAGMTTHAVWDPNGSRYWDHRKPTDHSGDGPHRGDIRAGYGGKRGDGQVWGWFAHAKVAASGVEVRPIK